MSSASGPPEHEITLSFGRERIASARGFSFCYTGLMQIVLLDAVEAFFSSLTEKEIAKAIRTIELLEEFGANLGMPHSRHMSGGLLELRVRGTREIRVFYCFHKNKAILLHAYVKKTQKAPENELRKARTAKDRLR